MPNPNPKQTPEFEAQQFKPQGKVAEPLCKMPINTRYEESVYEVLSVRSDRQALIRRYVKEGLQRDGFLQSGW